MRFDGPRVALTPPEAAFIEDVCAYHDQGSLPDAIRLKVKAGTLDFAGVTLTEGFEGIQGIGRYSALRFFAGQDWRPGDGEKVSVTLDASELARIKELATLAVMTAKEEAGNVGIDFEVASTVADLAFPDDIPIMALGESDEELLKEQNFEEKLQTIAVGDSIISAITAHEAG